MTAALKSISGTQKSHTARQGDKRTHEFGHNLPYSACGLVEEASVGRLRGSDHDFSPASRVCLPTNWSSTGHGRLQIGPPSRPGAYSSRFPTMANGGSRRGLYGEGRRTAVAAETHSPPHVQRGQTGPQRGRPVGRATAPVGRATRRKGDLYRKGSHRKVTHRKRSSDGRAKITKKKVFGSTAEIAARFTRRRQEVLSSADCGMQVCSVTV